MGRKRSAPVESVWKWLPALLITLPLSFGCGADDVDQCDPGVCPAPATCDWETGRCVLSGGPSAVTGEIGSQLSSALTSSGVLIVAAHDRSFRALVVGSASSAAEGAVDASAVDASAGASVASLLNNVVRVDSGANQGLYPSIGLNQADEPRVSYYDQGGGNLRVARYENGAWNRESDPVDGADGLDVGRFSSLVVDSTDGLHIAYRDDTNSALRIVSLGSAGCHPEGGALGEPVVVDAAVMARFGMPSADVGTYASIAIGPDGWLLVAFYDASRGNLVMARCSGSELTLQLLDGEDLQTGTDTGDVGRFASLAVDHASRKLGVAYFDASAGTLKFAGSRQGTLQVVTVDDGSDLDGSGPRLVGQAAALDYFSESPDVEGFPRIAYLDSTHRSVRLARRSIFGGWSTGDEVAARVADGEVGGVGVGLTLRVDRSDVAHLAFGSWRAAGATVELDFQLRRCSPTGCLSGDVE